MIRFDVPDMSCGHCTAAITKAVGAVDPAASVDCDLTTRIVAVESAVDTDTLLLAIKEAGYEAKAIESA